MEKKELVKNDSGCYTGHSDWATGSPNPGFHPAGAQAELQEAVRKGVCKMAAPTWIRPSGSSSLATVLHNKYIHTLELGQLLCSMRHPKDTCGLLSIVSTIVGQQVKGNKKKWLLSGTLGDVERSRVSTTVECGNIEISTPLLLGKCCRWLAQCLAHECFNQIPPLCCCWGTGVGKISNQVGALIQHPMCPRHC